MDIDGFEKWWDSEDGKRFCEEIKEKHERKEARHERFEKWLEDNDFDKLMNRLILEHDDDYIDKCYHNGYMPYPNRKLAFVVGYVFDNLAQIKVLELDCDFPNDIRLFKGYYFQHIHGQGTILRIYSKDDLKMLLQL